MGPARALFLADTHLGFDEPAKPRVERRRRGPDFFDAYERALAPAREGRVNFVVHGGDLFFRSRVSVDLAQRAYAPLVDVAERGVPVFIVPGNHERAHLPHPLFLCHPQVHVFDRPRTFTVEAAGMRIALAGFPFHREVGEAALRELLRETEWREQEADARLLCVHQAFDGAQVGVQDFTFQAGEEVIPRRHIPPAFTAVLAGHIHRAQVLDGGWAPPVLYPGATERTSFQEREEPKGYLLLELAPDRLVDSRFVPLPSRPMEVVHLDPRGLTEADVRERLRQLLHSLDPEAVVRIDVPGVSLPRALGADAVRAATPPGLNVSVRPVDAPRRSRRA